MCGAIRPLVLGFCCTKKCKFGIQNDQELLVLNLLIKFSCLFTSDVIFLPESITSPLSLTCMALSCQLKEQNIEQLLWKQDRSRGGFIAEEMWSEV